MIIWFPLGRLVATEWLEGKRDRETRPSARYFDLTLSHLVCGKQAPIILRPFFYKLYHQSTIQDKGLGLERLRWLIDLAQGSWIERVKQVEVLWPTWSLANFSF